MTDSSVGVIDQQGGGTKKVDVSHIVVNAVTVERQRVALGDGAAGDHLAGVSAAGGLHVEEVGSLNLATGQMSLTGTTAILVAAARTGAPGTGRRSITVINTGDLAVWLGADNTVTSSNGLPLQPGDTVTLPTQSAIWAVLNEGGTPVLAYYELF